MKLAVARAAGAWLLFGLITVLTYLICTAIGARTPVLHKGEALPGDIGENQYVLSRNLLEQTEEGTFITIPLSGRIVQELTLTLGDCEAYQLYINGEFVKSYDENDVFTRVVCIPLNRARLEKDGRLDILFTGDSWIGSESPSNVPKLLLSSSTMAQRSLNAAFGVTMLLIGAFFVLIVSNLTLFFRKQSERYLLLLAGASCVVMVTTLLTSTVTILPIRYGAYVLLRPYIAVFPVLVNGAVCLSLLRDSLPQWARRFIHPFWIVIVLAFQGLIQVTTGWNIYHLLTALLLIPVLGAIGCGARKKAPGTLLLLTGYALCQGIALRIYSINSAQWALSGAIGVYFLITQLGHLFYLLLCMVLINQRYAQKFGESEQLNLFLDAKVEERTSQLTAEQEQRRTMMVNIFHDLRSPLFVLRGHLEKLNPAAQEDPNILEDINQQLKFMQRLIEDLFLISKLENKKIHFIGDYVELHQLARQRLYSAQALAQRAGVELFASELSPALVWGDAMRLQQIIQNLFDNAVAYTPPGGKIILSLVREGEWAALSIADTGPGISQEDLPRVFDRYYHSSRSGSQKSTGLGLAIVKNLVELHRGTIELKSAPGKGTVFTVRLPLVEKVKK